MYVRYPAMSIVGEFDCTHCDAKLSLRCDYDIPDEVIGLYTQDEFSIRSIPYSSTFVCPECHKRVYFVDGFFVQ